MDLTGRQAGTIKGESRSDLPEHKDVHDHQGPPPSHHLPPSPVYPFKGPLHRPHQSRLMALRGRVHIRQLKTVPPRKPFST